MKTKKQKGFTLIELLVVISIISLLSSVVLASVKTGREKAVLTKTVAEMKSLQSAIELYRNQFGVYPGSLGNYPSEMYSDTDVADIGESSNYYVSTTAIDGSLESFQNTYLISNKLLVKPVLAPKYLEGCDSGCVNKGYKLFYALKGSLGSSFVLKCGGVPVNNYIIFLLANTKKINLPLYTVEYIVDGSEYNGGSTELAGTPSMPINNPPYTYCLSM